MKRKLFAYMFLLTAFLLSVLTAGLMILGRFNNTKKELVQTLNLQMEVFASGVESYWDRLAAKNITLASDMTDILETQLQSRHIYFSDLTDDTLAIADMEKAMIEPLCQYLRQVDCSGVFVILNTTVNSALANSDRSRSGLYIQKSSMRIPDYKLLLYRGVSAIGSQHNIVPHRKWHLEFNTDNFPDYEMLISQSLEAHDAYDISPITNLPGVSEDVVLITRPMVGSGGMVYGLCGFEVSRSWFKEQHSQPSNLPHMICLFNADSDVPDADRGFSAGIRNGYYIAPKGMFEVDKFGEGLVSLTNASDSYVGVMRKIPSFANGQEFLLTVMIPKKDYTHTVIRNRFQTSFLVLLILFFTVICCQFFTQQFLSPILKKLEQLKMNEQEQISFDLPEIDSLLDSLLEKTMRTEEKILSLEKQIEQKQTALEQLQDQHEAMMKEHAATQHKISQLAHADVDKGAVDPEQYQRFLECLDTLTKKEKEILNFYVQGKSSKDIILDANITENTLKYHNRNIYSKLGVNSRKQLLMYVALMKEK